MSYFKLYPEIRKDFNLERHEWMTFCLILSYGKVMMSTGKMADLLGISHSMVKRALKSLVDKQLIIITGTSTSSGRGTIKEVANRELYEYYTH